MAIAVLGWGSLLWEKRPEFQAQVMDWEFTGPSLPLEFSRISKTRLGALTLVIDAEFGEECVVAYALSRRRRLDDAIKDLRDREGTLTKRIGVASRQPANNRHRDAAIFAVIDAWRRERKFDDVIWTDLANNFEKEVGATFSVPRALEYFSRLDRPAMEIAMTYVTMAPAFVVTPFRRALTP